MFFERRVFSTCASGGVFSTRVCLSKQEEFVFIYCWRILSHCELDSNLKLKSRLEHFAISNQTQIHTTFVQCSTYQPQISPFKFYSVQLTPQFQLPSWLKCAGIALKCDSHHSDLSHICKSNKVYEKVVGVVKQNRGTKRKNSALVSPRWSLHTRLVNLFTNNK